jgi:hypothetical protein
MGKRLFSSSTSSSTGAPFEHIVVNFTDEMLENLPRKIEKLSVDVFHPLNDFDSDEDQDVKANISLKHLSSFCNLKYLKITGMLESYQSEIWLTAFMNPALKYLHLEMVLSPEISLPSEQKDTVSTWVKIDGSWKARNICDVEIPYPTTSKSSTYSGLNTKKCPQITYSGENGDGALNADLGSGEYLDALCMRKARDRASTLLASSVPAEQLKLRIEHLYLANFVVDALPFTAPENFFSTKYLRLIEFGEGCVDAGFVLPEILDKVVSVGFPSSVDEAGKEVTDGGHDIGGEGVGYNGGNNAGDAVGDGDEIVASMKGLRMAEMEKIGDGDGAKAKGPGTVVLVDKKGKKTRQIGRDPWERMTA